MSYVQAFCRQASRKHNTHGAISPAQSSNAIRADQSAKTQTSRVGESQDAVGHLQLAVLSKRTKKSKNARPTKVFGHEALGICESSVCALCPLHSHVVILVSERSGRRE